jgi:hypothetical protein
MWVAPARAKNCKKVLGTGENTEFGDNMLIANENGAPKGAPPN